MGAWDTLYYHEFRARLPAGMPGTKAELQLHGLRSLIYALLFWILPRWSFQGSYAIFLAILLGTEIVITLKDFVVEDWVRKPMGGVYPGERVMHAIMGIVYGAMLAFFLPILWAGFHEPTALVAWSDIPEVFVLALSAMSLGVLFSGLRDLAASLGWAWAAWPYSKH